eukprot:91186-Amphidinium_carterae.1
MPREGDGLEGMGDVTKLQTSDEQGQKVQRVHQSFVGLRGVACSLRSSSCHTGKTGNPEGRMTSAGCPSHTVDFDT